MCLCLQTKKTMPTTIVYVVRVLFKSSPSILLAADSCEPTVVCRFLPLWRRIRLPPPMLRFERPPVARSFSRLSRLSATNLHARSEATRSSIREALPLLQKGSFLSDLYRSAKPDQE